MSDTRQILIPPHVKATRVEGDYVLMDMKSGKYLGLDPVASTVWESLAEHGDLDRAAHDVCQSFEVELERARADVEAWVEEMVGKGVLARAGTGRA